MMRISFLLLLLAACAAPVPQRAPMDRAARIAVECRMLAEAHAATAATRGGAPDDILTGCPGHEGRRDTMPLPAQTAALRVAQRAVLPAAVLRAGPRGEEIYRRMITRGVPEPVAAGIAEGPAFRAAAGS